MRRLVLIALVLLAGCWQGSDRDMSIEILDLARGNEPLGPSAIQVGPNDWRIGFKSDITPGATIVESIELTGGVYAVYSNLVATKATFNNLPVGHGLLVNDVVDMHWFTRWGELDSLVTFNGVVSVAHPTDVDVNVSAIAGSLPADFGTECNLAKVLDVDITDCNTRDITKIKIVADRQCGCRGLTTADAPIGAIEIPLVQTEPQYRSEYEWSWRDQVSPPWPIPTPLLKLRCSAHDDTTLSIKLIRGGPRYRVWRGGQFIYSGICNWIEVSLDPDGECVPIEVADQSYLGPDPQVFPRVRLEWEVPASGEDVAYYRLEQYIDSAWTVIRQVQHATERHRHHVTLPALPGDPTAAQFRVTPVGLNGNEQSPVAVNVIVQRHPDKPNVATAYDEGTEKFTIAEV